MAKPENQFRSSVHGYLNVQDLHWEKMANPYRGGTADDWYSGKGTGSKDLWIEWKFVIVPARDDTLIDLRAGKKPPLSGLQEEWLRERYHEGRNVRVGIGSAKGGLILNDLEWERPLTAGEFRARLHTRAQLAGWITEFVMGKKIACKSTSNPSSPLRASSLPFTALPRRRSC